MNLPDLRLDGNIKFLGDNKSRYARKCSRRTPVYMTMWSVEMGTRRI